jgi:hypothetical protein
MVANPPWRPSVAARYPKPDSDGNYPPVYGTVAEFERAVKDGLLTKVGDLFVADQAMLVFPAPAEKASTPPQTVEPPAGSGDKPKRRGPEKGSSRYGAADRKLFPDLEKLVDEDGLSPTAAAKKLAEANRVKGSGTPMSRAKRLAGRYISDGKTR